MGQGLMVSNRELVFWSLCVVWVYAFVTARNNDINMCCSGGDDDDDDDDEDDGDGGEGAPSAKKTKYDDG